MNDCILFYKTRFLRFYPLLLLSVMSLYLGGALLGKAWFANDFQALSTVLGISLFFKPLPPTLWFFSMLMLFYLVTPILLIRKSFVYKVFASVLILIFFLLVDKIFYVDITLFQYFPFYLLGLIIPFDFFKFVNKYKYTTMLFTLMIVIIMSYYLLLDCYIYTSVSIFIGIIFLYSISSIINIRIFNSFFKFLSFSSLIAYLFHRHIYQLFAIILSELKFTINLTFSVLIILPTIFLISFYMQKKYDEIVNKQQLCQKKREL